MSSYAMPSPSAPPLIDLNPIPEPACDALGICIKEPP